MKLTRIGISKPTQHLLAHPLAFALQTLRGFNKNQGMMLAGAIAYYALLSMVPLLILSIIALTHLVDKADLLIALGRYLEWLVPSQSQAVLGDLNDFLDNGIAIGAVLLLTMLFFSSLAFGILEKAIALIFPHRGTVDKRHALVSAVLPYCFVLMLGVALLCMTLASIVLQAMAHESLHFLGRDWSLVGLIQWRHAVIGGFFVAGAWEVIRHALVWYFTTLSKASVVYGSFTTAVVALFCMEIIAALLLLGAQVMSEYERLEQF